MTDLNDQPNYTQMFTSAFQTGRQMAQQKGVQNALSMNATDPAGAQAALIQYGAIPEANALAQNSAMQRQLAVRQAAGQQFAQGDTQGAQATAASAGDFDSAAAIAKMTDEQRAQVAHVADVTNQALFGLSQLPQEQRQAGLQKIAPVLLQQGVSQAAIDHAAQSGLSDDFLKATAASTMSVKDQIASHQKDSEIQNTVAHNKALEDQAKADSARTAAYQQGELGLRAQSNSIEAGKASAAQWQVLSDPKTGQQYRYNTGSNRATTLDGQPYTPQGAGKIANGSVPRSAGALALKKFSDENPDATPEQISQFGAHVGAQAKAAKDFGTGPQGNQVRSMNVSIAHLDTLGQLADELNNGPIPVGNQVAQVWKQQTGQPAPANFNAAKQIVGDEVIKGIIGSGGGVGDREAAQKQIDAASSPAQLKGVIRTYKSLLAGQLGGLKQQYQRSTGLDDFEKMLNPTTQRELEAHSGAPAGQGKPSLQDIFGH